MDKEIVDLCKKSDEQALSLLYKNYSEKMLKICLRYVSDRQIAEDLLHDGFIVIFTSIETLRCPDKLESWMGMIMKNISLRYLNQRKAINTISLSDIEKWEEPVSMLPSDKFPSHDIMLKAVEKLPDGYRKVFKLAVLEGLSHREIGALLGIAPHSSSSQLFRAKKMLRRFILGYSIAILLLSLLALPFGIGLNTKRETIKKNKEAELKKEKTNKKKIDTWINDSIKSIVSPTRSIQYAQLKTVADTVVHEPALKGSIAELIQIKDTVNGAENKTTERKGKELPQATNVNYSLTKKKYWSLTLSYSGGESQSNTLHSTIPGNITSGKPEVVEERIHHRMPVTLSLSIHKKLNERWGIETGIHYTHLRTDFTTLSKSYTERVQRISYLGIPVRGVMQIWKQGDLSIYASAGATLDIPIKATSEETFKGNGQPTIRKKQAINAPLQWSIGLGAGFQYNITPSIGIYAEPNLHYYFNNANKWNTSRKEQPIDIALPIGIRFSW